MSLPQTCPFCGSGVDLRNGEKWVGFTCITTIHAGHDARRMQSMTCAGLERTRLLASVAVLEARCKRLEEAARAVYLDSIASDHPWAELETRNMHALRDVLEAKP